MSNLVQSPPNRGVLHDVYYGTRSSVAIAGQGRSGALIASKTPKWVDVLARLGGMDA